MQKKRKESGWRASAGRRVLVGTAGLAGLVANALAQQAAESTPPPKPANVEAAQPVQVAQAAQNPPTTTAQAAPAATAQTQSKAPVIDTIYVTGYTGSLVTSTKAKRESTGFQDAVFAEDMGKFPDSNIAESLNRIPGVLISREVTGEGLNISIRGLGTSFTKILLNGAPVAVASTGRTDNQNTNREVDLDLLPTELFRKLTVSKSPTASMIEGGAAGVVDMRTARPFDNPGRYVAVSVQGTQNNVADKWGNRGSVLASQTWGEKFGILGGIAWSEAKVRTTGFETIGWTNPNLSASQSSSTARNATGGGNWTIPGTVPVNAGNGLTAGQTIDQAFLLARNPGLTIDQIDNAIIPRLGRNMDETGTKDKIAGIVSLEYRPTSSLYFYLDALAGRKDNKLERVDMNWVGRNGAMVPLNMAVDRTDCAAGCVVTRGTFANSQFFLEYRPYSEDVTLHGFNPGMEWQISKNLLFDAQANYTKSEFHRSSPSVVAITPASSGLTVQYENNGNLPSITSNVDLNNPASFGWAGGRVNMQDELRDTETKGARGNLTWGEKELNLKVGVAYDDVSRRIRARDNSGAWQAATCGNNPSIFLLGPNGGPACDGANTPGASAAGLYPGFGTGYTAGINAPLVYQGSLIPSSALASYLMPGPSGFVTVDWARFARDSGYEGFRNSAPEVGSSNTGASAGFVQEKSSGFYTEVNGIGKPLGFETKYNAGARWVRTKQTVGGFISLADPRNAAQNLPNGAKYPNVDNTVYLSTSYSNVLPSATAATNLAKDVVLRTSVSRSMTRADPNALRPGINFSSPSADVGSVGNETLKPYLSDNLDLGLEWYTGREGYVSATGFLKRIDGFTTRENITVPFGALAQYGVTFDALSPTQQAAINARGGPAAANVVLQRDVNAEGKLKINGLELNWVQPLDRWMPVKGFGFSANFTRINQKSTGALSGAVALGVPKKSNNFTAYYEQHGYMLRLSRSYADGSQSANANQNGIPLAALYTDSYKQVDFSSSFDLERIFDRDHLPQLTLDVINLNNDIQRSYFQYSNATFTQYKPSRTIVLGVRAKF